MSARRALVPAERWCPPSVVPAGRVAGLRVFDLGDCGDMTAARRVMSQTHWVDVRGEVVVKTYVDWSRGEHLREWAALRVISAAEPGLVPVPIELAPPLGSRPSVRMSRLPGRPLGGRLTDGQLRGLQQALARLWAVPAEGLPPIDLEGFVLRVRRSISAWEGAGDDRRGRDHGRGGIIAEGHAAAIAWLSGAQVDELVEPRQIVVGHGDPNLANYLWDGERVRIIDFEDAGRCDLAVELANLVEHLASRATDWSSFLDCYSVDPERLMTARRLYAAFWLTLIRPGGPSADRNPPDTAERQAERLLQLLDDGRCAGA